MSMLHHPDLVQIQINGKCAQKLFIPKTQLKSHLLFATFPDFPLPLPDRVSHFLLFAHSGLHANIILKALTLGLVSCHYLFTCLGDVQSLKRKGTILFLFVTPAPSILPATQQVPNTCLLSQNNKLLKLYYMPTIT